MLTAEYGWRSSRSNLFHTIRMANTFEDERTVQTLSALQEIDNSMQAFTLCKQNVYTM
jgi:hypothetical protein